MLEWTRPISYSRTCKKTSLECVQCREAYLLSILTSSTSRTFKYCSVNSLKEYSSPTRRSVAGIGLCIGSGEGEEWHPD